MPSAIDWSVAGPIILLILQAFIGIVEFLMKTQLDAMERRLEALETRLNIKIDQL